MKCPIDNNTFAEYDFYLNVNDEIIYFCSAECRAKGKKVLIYNTSRLSTRRIRQLLKEVYQSKKIKPEEPKKEEAKTEVKKEEPKPETKKRKLNTFAYRLFMERVLSDFSIEDLSKASGVPTEIIKKLENGECSPTQWTSTQLAKALNISIGKLGIKTKKDLKE